MPRDAGFAKLFDEARDLFAQVNRLRKALSQVCGTWGGAEEPLGVADNLGYIPDVRRCHLTEEVMFRVITDIEDSLCLPKELLQCKAYFLSPPSDLGASGAQGIIGISPPSDFGTPIESRTALRRSGGHSHCGPTGSSNSSRPRVAGGFVA